MCVASGPGKDMFESTLIIATKQYEKAKDLYATANVTGMKLSGPVDFRHQHADMSNVKFQLPSGEQVWYCYYHSITLVYLFRQIPEQGYPLPNFHQM